VACLPERSHGAYPDGGADRKFLDTVGRKTQRVLKPAKREPKPRELSALAP